MNNNKESNENIITFSSCFYIIKSKFDPSMYITWMNHFLSIVCHFNLVIYCDEVSCRYINIRNNPHIKLVIKPLDQFYMYRYKDQWIENHAKNTLLRDKSCWELNMLWSEKIFFVKETQERAYFDTEFYGWCDIGYFRNRREDTPIQDLTHWCGNAETIRYMATDKICYACITTNSVMNYLHSLVSNVNQVGLPSTPIPPDQTSIAGGFFLTHKKHLSWWADTYDATLRLYFSNHYLVKDDQMILVNCILANLPQFMIVREHAKNANTCEHKDPWFLFQRILNK